MPRTPRVPAWAPYTTYSVPRADDTDIPSWGQRPLGPVHHARRTCRTLRAETGSAAADVDQTPGWRQWNWPRMAALPAVTTDPDNPARLCETCLVPPLLRSLNATPTVEYDVPACEDYRGSHGWLRPEYAVIVPWWPRVAFLADKVPTQLARLHRVAKILNWPEPVREPGIAPVHDSYLTKPHLTDAWATHGFAHRNIIPVLRTLDLGVYTVPSLDEHEPAGLDDVATDDITVRRWLRDAYADPNGWEAGTWISLVMTMAAIRQPPASGPDPASGRDPDGR